MTDGPSELNKTPRDNAGAQSKLSRESDSPLKSQLAPSNSPMGERSDIKETTTRTMFPSKSVPAKKGKKKKSISPPIPSGRLISVDNKPVREGRDGNDEKTEKTSHM